MIMNIYETLSLVASGICFLANWLLHARDLSKQKYAMLTTCTSIMFLISAFGFMNKGAIISEILWLGLSIYGIFRPIIEQKTHTKSRTHIEDAL